MVPPAGGGILRMRRLQARAGLTGNRPPGAAPGECIMLPRLWIVLALALPSAALAEDLVTNGGFEQGGGSSAAGWQTHCAEGDYAFAIAGGAHSGTRCLSITAGEGTTQGWARWYSSDLFLVAGATYRLSAWVRTEGETTAHVWMPGVTPEFSAYLSKTPEWTRVEGTFTAEATGRQGLYLQSRAGGTVYFDDVSITLAEAPPSDAGEEVPTDGAPLTGIVVPAQAGPHAIHLALETRRVLATMTGRSLAIRLGAGEGRCVWIDCRPPGRSYAEQLALVGAEGIVLDVGADAVVCLGNTPRGVYYAVHEFLYRLGCRWCEPGPLGEAIPATERLRLDPALIVHRPSFDLRGGHVVQAFDTPPDYAVRHCDTEAYVEWAARNRMNRLKASYPDTWDYGAIRGYGVDEVAGHSLHAILPPERWFASHPEYYPLAGGQRTHLHQSGRAAEICVSNPDLPQLFADRICEYFDSHPTALRYCINAEDEPSTWCECEACKALDASPQDWSRNGLDNLAMTDRWLWFINRVAEIVEQRHPDKWISTFAYASTRALPVREKPRRNVMIELTWWDECFKHRVDDPACAINAKGFGQFLDWSRLAPVALYRYLDYYHFESPCAYYHAEADILRTAHAGGCRFLSDEWDTTFGASPLLLNLRARLEWDVDTDVEQFIDRLCASVYGPAGLTMAAYYRRLESGVTHSASEHVPLNDLGRFPDDLLRDAAALLDRATAEAAADETVLARIDRQRFALLFAELDKVTEAAAQDPAQFARQAEIQARLREIADRRGIAPVEGYYGRFSGGYAPPVEALTATKVLTMPEQWRFRADPDDRGLAEGWHAGAPEAEWETLSILQPWEEQGHPGYDGLGWYTVDVEAPAFEGARAWFLCEAVDETFRLWIDGEEVGASEGEPGVLWDKPVAVEVTGALRPGQRQRFTLRVHDTAGAGGIWKPVWIVAR